MNPPPNFNRLANLYRWMEWFSFGPMLSWSRTAFLPEAAACRHALVLGDGDGRFTARLLAANPDLTGDAVDASNSMLGALIRRAGPNSIRVRTHTADIRTWQPDPGNPPYDLIVTHFFLDCLTTDEIQSLASTLRPAIAPSAIWILSDFAIPSNLLGRLAAKLAVSSLYLAFACLTGLTVRTLPDHSTALRNSGFILQDRRTRLAGLLISERWTPSPQTPPTPWNLLRNRLSIHLPQ